MRHAFLLAPLAIAGGLLLALPPPSPAAEEPEVAGFFRENCASCHAVPDPAIRADRAWLGQLERTA